MTKLFPYTQGINATNLRFTIQESDTMVSSDPIAENDNEDEGEDDIAGSEESCHAHLW